MYLLHVLPHIVLDSLACPLLVFSLPFSSFYFIKRLIIIGTFELGCVIFNRLVFQFLFQVIFVLFISKPVLINEILFMLLLFLFPFFVRYGYSIKVPETSQMLLPLFIFRFFVLLVAGFVFLIQRIGPVGLAKYSSCVLLYDNFVFFPVILTNFNIFCYSHTLIGIDIV